MELPQEIFDEILGHLRHEWAAYPTALSKSGLQIALTCTWLYRELIPEVQSRQSAILEKAMDTWIPGPPPHHHPLPLLRVESNGSSGDLPSGSLPTPLSSHNVGSMGIYNIELNLPVLRGSDTDLIWSIQRLISRIPRNGHPMFPSFYLAFHRTGTAVVEAEGGERAKWVYRLVRMLEEIILQQRWFIHLSFHGPSGEDDGDEDLRDLLQSQVLPGQQGTGEVNGPVPSSFLSRLQGVFTAIKLTRRPECSRGVTFKGTLSNPLLYAYAGFIVKRSPYLPSLCLRDCSTTPSVWNSTFTSWTLPRLCGLILRDVNIPITALIPFLARHPSVKDLSIAPWERQTDACRTRTTLPHTPETPPKVVHIVCLTGDPPFLKALFESHAVELPALRRLYVDCTYQASFDRDDLAHWADVTQVLVLLGQHQAAMRVMAPVQLELDLSHGNGLLQWLGTVRRKEEGRHQEGSSSRAEKASNSLLDRLRPAQKPSATIGEPNDGTPLLVKGLRSLRCVTSFRMITWSTASYQYPGDSVDLSTVIDLVSHLPSVKKAIIGAYFVKSESSWRERELWDDVRRIWSRVRSLKRVEIYDSNNDSYYSGGGGGYIAGGSPFSAGGSPGGARRSEISHSLRPMSIAQLHKATQAHTDAEWRLDDQEIGQLTVVAQVVSISPQATNCAYMLEDGTGTFEARRWADQESELNEQNWAGLKPNMYVRVTGGLKAFGNKRYINAIHLRPIADPHEVFFHILETITVTLTLERGPPGGGGRPAAVTRDVTMADASAYNAPSTTTSNQWSHLPPLQKAILEFLQREGTSAEGVHVFAITRAVGSGSDAAGISTALDKLMDDGFVYTTSDDSHFTLAS